MKKKVQSNAESLLEYMNSLEERVEELRWSGRKRKSEVENKAESMESLLDTYFVEDYRKDGAKMRKTMYTLAKIWGIDLDNDMTPMECGITVNMGLCKFFEKLEKALKERMKQNEAL